MKASNKLLVLGLVIVAIALAAGCSSAPGERELRLGNIGWDENVAIANLTKVLLEEDLGYERVTIQTIDLGLVFQGVSTGDLDAFQDVWLPNHQELLGQVGDEVVLLDNWFEGQTEFGIAVPNYVNATSIPDLNNTSIDEILGIEPGSIIMEKIPDSVVPTYGLRQDLVESSTAGMLSEVDRRYNNQEDFSFIAWSPHWMNQRYDFRLLEDPEDALEELNDGAEVTSIVNEALGDEDPVAFAFMNAIRLNEEQVNQIEDEINRANDPEVGVRNWIQDNRDVVEPWLEAARNAQ
jgi:glycine betaine/proline transport system substrate-binding protein